MSRKIQPEQTKATILGVSEKLFVEKGYEATTTQELVDTTGLAKGTIFHHYKSKEEILAAVLDVNLDRVTQKIDNRLAEMDCSSAKEKLTRLFDESDSTPDDETDLLLFKMAITTGSPHIIVAGMKKWTEKVSPIIAGIIKAGIEDNSIATDFPDECAQLIMLICAVWIDPVTLACDEKSLNKRLRFIQHTMRTLGVDIVSDDFIANVMKFAENLYS
jgi:AcrR family transcriptional regulator